MSTANAQVVVTKSELELELERLRSENAQLKAEKESRRPSMSMKVSPKGALHFSGINGKYGVTLYVGQLEAFFKFCEVPVPVKIQSFIDANRAALSTGKTKTETVTA